MARENSCSKGHDKISVNTIKNCSDQLVAYICMIFNRSIEDGVVPDDLKSVQLPKMDRDAKFVHRLCNEVLDVGVTSTDISRLFRLGKNGKVRPLLRGFHCIEKKQR